MTREEKIREAVKQARAKGIKIVRGPCFDWTKPDPNGGWPIHSGNKPSACDAVGAMFLYVGHKNEWPYNWKPLLKEFDINGFWIYRFHIGFSVGNQIMVEIENKKTKKKTKIPDKVCKLGIKLAKEFVR